MNPKPTPQRRAANEDSATRERLLEATGRIVATEGLTAATSRRITAAAGANLAAITYHFGSKDALVHAALAWEVERLVEPAMTLLEAATDDPVQRLLGATQQLLQTFEQQRERSPAYLVALVEAVRRQDGGADGPAAVVGRLRNRLSAVISALIGNGTVPRWVDPDAMASLIVATANGIALQSALEPDGPTPLDQALQFAQLLLSAQADRPAD